MVIRRRPCMIMSTPLPFPLVDNIVPGSSFDGDRNSVITLPRTPSAGGAGSSSPSRGQAAAAAARSKRCDWECTKVRIKGQGQS